MIYENKLPIILIILMIQSKLLDILTTVLGVAYFGLEEYNPLGFKTVIIGSVIIVLILLSVLNHSLNTKKLLIPHNIADIGQQFGILIPNIRRFVLTMMISSIAVMTTIAILNMISIINSIN